jgi:hypothetical protein
MTPLEYVAAVILAAVIGYGVGVIVWMVHRKHFL